MENESFSSGCGREKVVSRQSISPLHSSWPSAVWGSVLPPLLPPRKTAVVQMLVEQPLHFCVCCGVCGRSHEEQYFPLTCLCPLLICLSPGDLSSFECAVHTFSLFTEELPIPRMRQADVSQLYQSLFFFLFPWFWLFPLPWIGWEVFYIQKMLPAMQEIRGSGPDTPWNQMCKSLELHLALKSEFILN